MFLMYNDYIKNQLQRKMPRGLTQNKRTHLRVIAAGNMKPMQTAAVAPVNWKASQMLGMKFAAKKIKERSSTVTNANLRLSEDSALAEGKRRPSKFRRRAKKIIGKTSMR